MVEQTVDLLNIMDMISLIICIKPVLSRFDHIRTTLHSNKIYASTFTAIEPTSLELIIVSRHFRSTWIAGFGIRSRLLIPVQCLFPLLATQECLYLTHHTPPTRELQAVLRRPGSFNQINEMVSP